MMSSFHPRLTPARPDLAARSLEGKVTAARFVDGEARAVIEPHLPLRRSPAPDAGLDTEALMGERVTVYETTDEGWAWGQLDADGYVGFMPASGLAAPGPAPTHRVSALRTLVFPAPSFKLPPIGALPLGATEPTGDTVWQQHISGDRRPWHQGRVLEHKADPPGRAPPVAERGIREKRQHPRFQTEAGVEVSKRSTRKPTTDPPALVKSRRGT